MIDRDTQKLPREQLRLMRQALLADTFLMSANGFSEDGHCLMWTDATVCGIAVRGEAGNCHAA
jgi:hypothetical protein